MMRRLHEVPKYSETNRWVEARYFNKIHLALRHLPSPIRLQLKNLRHIDMIIDHDSWTCVDNSLNDLPIAAWTDFATNSRDNLHEPIECKLSYYHFKAALVAREALEHATEFLNERLAASAEKTVQRPLAGPKKRHFTSNKRELFVVS